MTLDKLHNVAQGTAKVALDEAVRETIEGCRRYLDDKIEREENPIYGINTGFGSLCDVSISKSDLNQLQENLVMSHACGMGAEVPAEIVRLMLVLKAQSLSLGHSGIQLKTVELLLAFYNNDLLPVVHEMGSLGASGDLSPLAHLSLPLIGKGGVLLKGKRMTAADALKKCNLETVKLTSKEGLALLNGTQFMQAFGVFSLLKAKKISYMADVVGALSLEAFLGRPEPFDEKLHLIRPHNGQLKTAANIREFLQGSEIQQLKKQHVQDPYSFRCMPQVHGASKDALAHVERVFETEINAVTDNPTIFPEEDQILSGGNFHGQPLAINLDFLCIACAEWGSISERRTYQLVNGRRGLPAFLVANPGLNSGFMIPQYSAASMVSQNKQLCTPASVDTIDSSNGQEDHVSMGANAATKALRVVLNTERILAIELMTAAQALDFRPEQSSEFLQSLHAAFREDVPFVENDVEMHPLMQQSLGFLQGIEIDSGLL